MSVAVPTASSIKMLFPEFSDVDDAVVEFAIENARADVGDGENWAANASVALTYLSAHYVSASIANAASGGSGGAGEIASESIGRLSITYAQTKSSNSDATADDKESTSYGRRYLELVEANFSGPVIV